MQFDAIIETTGLALDTEKHEVEVPEALGAALSPSHRKRHVLAVTGAKTDETRQRRIEKVLAELMEA